MPDDKEGGVWTDAATNIRQPRNLPGARSVTTRCRSGRVSESDGFDVEVLGVANTQFRD